MDWEGGSGVPRALPFVDGRELRIWKAGSPGSALIRGLLPADHDPRVETCGAYHFGVSDLLASGPQAICGDTL